MGYRPHHLSGPTTSDGAELQRIYRNRFTERDRRKKEHVWKVIVQSYLQRWIRPQDAVLDLGCGYGEFLNNIQCARRIGVDMNPDSPQRLARGIEFHGCDLTQLSPIRDGEIDVVFTSNTLEHLASKEAVETALGDVRRVLKRGGQLIAMGPNMRILGGLYWDYWDHHVPISDRSLIELLTNLGFNVEQCFPRFLPYTTHSALPKSAWLVWLYLKIPLAWYFLGGQFLIRAHKL